MHRHDAAAQETVAALEAAVVAFLDAAPGPDTACTLTLPSGFERLLLHGVAQFHGLVSASAAAADGARVTTLRLAPQPQARCVVVHNSGRGRRRLTRPSCAAPGRPDTRLTDLLYPPPPEIDELAALMLEC